jgi:hypothetical protein
VKRWHPFLPELRAARRAVVWWLLVVVFVLLSHWLGWLPSKPPNPSPLPFLVG